VKGDWRPGTSREILQLRAQLLGRTRAFFAERGILEVETPALARTGTTDPALDSFVTQDSLSTDPRYLHASPEHAMKRLLASGSGSIYQLCRVFRRGERGRNHNPELTLLEWYRPGLGYRDLMDEVAQLLTELLPGKLLSHRPRYLTWNEVFSRLLGIEALAADAGALARCAGELGLEVPATLRREGRDVWLDLLMTHAVEARLPRDRLVFVYRYPASQAALAQIEPSDPRVARRFETYFNGMELANGFQELGDAVEQRRRFETERDRRAERGLPEVPMDERMLAALAHGLPECSGVALGFDRLVMVAGELESIDQAMAFSWDRL
jgi:lysyl-tRNA synthetase class 2